MIVNLVDVIECKARFATVTRQQISANKHCRLHTPYTNNSIRQFDNPQYLFIYAIYISFVNFLVVFGRHFGR